VKIADSKESVPMPVRRPHGLKVFDRAVQPHTRAEKPTETETSEAAGQGVKISIIPGGLYTLPNASGKQLLRPPPHQPGPVVAK